MSPANGQKKKEESNEVWGVRGCGSADYPARLAGCETRTRDRKGQKKAGGEEVAEEKAILGLEKTNNKLGGTKAAVGGDRVGTMPTARGRARGKIWETSAQRKKEGGMGMRRLRKPTLGQKT